MIDLTITSALLHSHIGGQAQIKNDHAKGRSRGEIKAITIEGLDIKIEFAWRAKDEGWPKDAANWVRDPNLEYRFQGLDSCAAYHLVQVSGDKITCVKSFTGDFLELFPPNARDWLDPVTLKFKHLEFTQA